MFTKSYDIDKGHIDFQGVVDGLYYPFYLEWCRHAYMREVVGIDIEEEFTLHNRLYMVLEYNLKFRKSLKEGDKVDVSCNLVKNEKRTRINFEQKILVNGEVYAEAIFVTTCLSNGRPSIPESIAAFFTE